MLYKTIQTVAKMQHKAYQKAARRQKSPLVYGNKYYKLHEMVHCLQNSLKKLNLNVQSETV